MNYPFDIILHLLSRLWYFGVQGGVMRAIVNLFLFRLKQLTDRVVITVYCSRTVNMDTLYVLLVYCVIMEVLTGRRVEMCRNIITFQWEFWMSQK